MFDILDKIIEILTRQPIPIPVPVDNGTPEVNVDEED